MTRLEAIKLYRALSTIEEKVRGVTLQGRDGKIDPMEVVFRMYDDQNIVRRLEKLEALAAEDATYILSHLHTCATYLGMIE